MDSLHRVPRAKKKQRGITLVESAITLALLAVLVCSAAPSFSRLIERQRLGGLASQLATDVQFVRSASVWRNEPLRLSLYSATGGTCYVLHSGARDQCTCTAPAVTAVCTGGAVALKATSIPASTGLSVQSNVASILFDPLHGTSTPAGTLRVVSTTAGSIHHIVNVLGRIRTCTPTGSPALPGYRTC